HANAQHPTVSTARRMRMVWESNAHSVPTVSMRIVWIRCCISPAPDRRGGYVISQLTATSSPLIRAPDKPFGRLARTGTLGNNCRLRPFGRMMSGSLSEPFRDPTRQRHLVPRLRADGPRPQVGRLVQTPRTGGYELPPHED